MKLENAKKILEKFLDKSIKIPKEILDDAKSTLATYNKVLDQTNDAFKKFYTDDNRYFVLKGSGGSGKSVFTAQYITFKVSTESGHRILVVRKVASSNRDSTFKLLKETINKDIFGSSKNWNINKTEMTITHSNGSEIIFRGLDDVEKIKSITNITLIWCEEATELLVSDFYQLKIRLRGQSEIKKHMILTFNPIYDTHWLKKTFFDSKHDFTTISETTYKDNRFLPPEDIETLLSFKNTDPYYYNVYALGNWGITGTSVFDCNKIQKRKDEIIKLEDEYIGFSYEKYHENDFIKIKNVSANNVSDDVKIFCRPQPGVPYSIGVDIAGEGSDDFVAIVINNMTKQQVATFTESKDELFFAEILFCLGTYYNNALIGVEINFGTYVLKKIIEFGYSNLYIRQKVDDYNDGLETKFGFRTGKDTRPLILSNLINYFNSNPEIVCDFETISQFEKFVKNPKKHGRLEACPGEHDDHVLAFAIALYCGNQQRMYLSFSNDKEDDEDDKEDSEYEEQFSGGWF